MPDTDTIRRILYEDPIWSAYAIADMQIGIASCCTWNLGSREGCAAAQGLVMLYHGLTPPVLFTTGGPDCVAHALENAQAAGNLPQVAYMSIRTEHEPVVQQWYDYAADRRPMYRMVRRRIRAEGVPDLPGLVRLHEDDAPRLQALYSTGGAFAPDAFDPAQLAGGVFYGIEDNGGALLAAGGTHIVDWDAGIGAIGNFYTQPGARRQGYAAALLAAIVRDLAAAYVDTIVLNVDQRNADASRLYERHGFVIHCPFIEGVGTRVR